MQALTQEQRDLSASQAFEWCAIGLGAPLVDPATPDYLTVRAAKVSALSSALNGIDADVRTALDGFVADLPSDMTVKQRQLLLAQFILDLLRSA